MRAAVLLAVLAASPAPAGPDGLSFEQLATLREVVEARVAPDGRRIAYTVRVPQPLDDEGDGPAWTELHVVAIDGGWRRPFVTGRVAVEKVRFDAAGSLLTYLAVRDGDERAALWAIPLDGGESRRLLAFETAIEDYALSPDGLRVAFVAREAESEERRKLRTRGYAQEVFEEDWRPRRVWVAPLPALDRPVAPAPTDPAAAPAADPAPRALDLPGSAFDVAWSPDGSLLAVTLAPSPSIDDRYMRRRVHLVDPASGAIRAKIETPGKLGVFQIGPAGERIALISAADLHDPAAGRLLVASTAGGATRDALPDLAGHVRSLAWQDRTTVMVVVDEGCETWFGEVDLETGRRKVHARSDGGAAPLLGELSLSRDGRVAAFVGESPRHPPELFAMRHGDPAPRRLSEVNPWLAEVALAPQEVVRWTARDGLSLEGVLMRPLGGEAREGPPPLLLMVHGGPESHDRNGWVTSYARPGQLAAARGYAVLYPNYRGSSGRGVEFSKLGQGDAAGREFDDLLDAVDHLVAAGMADPDRVGVTGRSYGGYATAWCATRHSARFRAGVMLVGVGNKLSKSLTTELPFEDETVHTRRPPLSDWRLDFERSPIAWVEGARTPLLIAVGAKDTRVDPSQSLQLYRALKRFGKAPVRYVRYPDEGHPIRAAAARDDYAHRLLQWMDHFVGSGLTFQHPGPDAGMETRPPIDPDVGM